MTAFSKPLILMCCTKVAEITSSLHPTDTLYLSQVEMLKDRSIFLMWHSIQHKSAQDAQNLRRHSGQRPHCFELDPTSWCPGDKCEVCWMLRKDGKHEGHKTIFYPGTLGTDQCMAASTEKHLSPAHRGRSAARQCVHYIFLNTYWFNVGEREQNHITIQSQEHTEQERHQCERWNLFLMARFLKKGGSKGQRSQRQRGMTN